MFSCEKDEYEKGGKLNLLNSPQKLLIFHKDGLGERYSSDFENRCAKLDKRTRVNCESYRLIDVVPVVLIVVQLESILDFRMRSQSPNSSSSSF